MPDQTPLYGHACRGFLVASLVRFWDCGISASSELPAGGLHAGGAVGGGGVPSVGCMRSVVGGRGGGGG